MTLRHVTVHAMKLIPLISLLLLGMASTTMAGSDDELDTDLMQTIDDTTKSVTSNIDLHKAAPATADAQERATLFRQVQAFYEKRHGAEDAVGYSRTCLDLAARIEASLKQQDFRAAAVAANDLTRTCRSCHDVYKPLS